MLSIDVVVAGGGVSGLLIASALAPKCSVLLLEQSDSIPRNKYWLTNEKPVSKNPHFETCIDRRYDYLDYTAYDGLTASVRGKYCLWDTEKLLGQLTQEIISHGGQILTGHRLYSLSYKKNGIIIHANSKVIQARLLVDCMGFGSPLVGAKNIATITGYYILHGYEVGIREDVRPIGLDNVVIDKYPAFFELFPTSKGTAHASIILPSRQFKTTRSIKGELSFILQKSHHSENIMWDSAGKQKPYFGIVPVGRLHEPVSERIVFFGEAGQANPAASATGLTRMLHTYQELAMSIEDCLRQDTLGRKSLSRAIPQYMTRLNRVFQESLFESLLSYNSDDFRRLVEELKNYPDDAVNDLIFAEFDFLNQRSFRLAVDALLRPRGMLGRHVLKSLMRFCLPGSLF
jgi:flavin-dependent dehydrogenase